MALQYRVAKLFAHKGVTFTNARPSLDALKKLPRDVRDHHIANGNLIEWDDNKVDSPPAAPAAASTTSKGA